MKILKQAFTIITIISLYLLSANSILPKEPDLDYIIQKAKQNQSRLYNTVNNAVFMANGVYKEIGKDAKIEKTVLTERRIYAKKAKRHEEYISMTVNGKKLEGKEMEKELKDWQKRGKPQTETKMPLTPEGDGAYNFRLIGDQKLKGTDIWVIGFEPKKKDDGYIIGKLYISKADFGLIRTEFSPAKTSRVIEHINLALDYSEFNGYWMPAKFKMDLKIKIGLLVNLYSKQIIVEDTYSQYQFNSKIDESKFKS